MPFYSFSSVSIPYWTVMTNNQRASILCGLVLQLWMLIDHPGNTFIDSVLNVFRCLTWFSSIMTILFPDQMSMLIAKQAGKINATGRQQFHYFPGVCQWAWRPGFPSLPSEFTRQKSGQPRWLQQRTMNMYELAVAIYGVHPFVALWLLIEFGPASELAGLASLKELKRGDSLSTQINY